MFFRVGRKEAKLEQKMFLERDTASIHVFTSLHHAYGSLVSEVCGAKLLLSGRTRVAIYLRSFI